jgi:hypothetical protein
MVILFSPGVTAQQYYELEKRNSFPQVHICPNPGCRARDTMWLNGFYQRNVITLSMVHRIYVRRARCKRCGISVAFLPDFALPRFQYSARIIVATLLLRLVRGFSLALSEAALRSRFHEPATCPSIPLISYYRRRFSHHEQLVAITALASGRSLAGCPLVQAISTSGSVERFSLMYRQATGTDFMSAR